MPTSEAEFCLSRSESTAQFLRHWSHPIMTHTDRDLLFGVIALQNDLIDTRQFVDAFTLWALHKIGSLADLLIERGWLDPMDRNHIEYLVERHIKKHWILAESPVPADPSMHTAPNVAKAQTHQLRKGATPGDPLVRVSPISAPLRDDGRLRLLGVLSTGGIGQVWKALDQVFDRTVALKELKPELATNPQHQERFVREAQITGQLEHPGIVPVYDFHAGDGATRCYYTMRFVKGRTLTEVIREYHRERLAGGTGRFLPLLQNFISICQTIAYAHSRNVIHRDLKGDNIIVGDFGEVIVLDWGLAKRLDDNPAGSASEPDRSETMAYLEPKPDSVTSPSATVQGDRLGTPAYMAPEQATGQIQLIDARTDVYGLAAILYEILVGEPPFWGTSILDTVHKVIHEPPVPPRERVGEVPVELEKLCLRGLAKDRNDRPGSAAELALRVQFWIAERAERKRTEQERERFFNLSMDLLAILDLEGRLTQTNPAWGTILGWSAEQLHGHEVRDFIHPDDRHRMTMALERLLASESATDVELQCVTRGGSYRWIHWNATLIRGESALYVVGRDVSERKQAEQMFRDLLESAPDAMVVVNSAGCVVLVNTQMERLFGYTREEVLGQPIEVYVPRAYRADHVAKVQAYIANPSFRPMGIGRELTGQHKDGHAFPVEISLSPVRTEQGLLISCAIRGK
ncbi:MAG: PAS domain S-box protein [Planctomycetes bacterium]|nr:PAS domain S-box protein [Planctomycetota bacterium]